MRSTIEKPLLEQIIDSLINKSIKDDSFGHKTAKEWEEFMRNYGFTNVEKLKAFLTSSEGNKNENPES